MTRPITTELNKERYCLVKVRENATNIKLSRPTGMYLGYDYGKNIGSVEMPAGNWSIIGLGKDLTNDQWMEIIEKEVYPLVVGYKDYNDEDGLLSFPFESGLSWLKALGADENYLILKEIK